ncbi:MAG: hypothetical protein ACO36E_12750 [Synechocystis sp.]
MAKKLSIPEIRITSEEQQQVFAEAVDPLVSLKDIDIQGGTLPELTEIIQKAHASFQSHLADALQAALIAGRALIVAKDQFTYDRQTGGFRGWLKEIGISKSSAYRYIELATNEPVVSQAGTLSEAMDLLAQHRAEQRALKAALDVVEVKNRRVTLKLTSEGDQKLERIAEKRGVEIATLTTEILEQWLANQKDS